MTGEEREFVVVSGRVPAAVAARVDATLAQQGQSRYSLINDVWAYVAGTGRLPTLVTTSGSDALSRFASLRERSAERVASREGVEPD